MNYTPPVLITNYKISQNLFLGHAHGYKQKGTYVCKSKKRKRKKLWMGWVA
jgi:hypothetical protein